MESGPAEIDVEVVYAESQRAIVKTYRLARHASIEEAIRQAAADPDFAGIDVASAAVGVFGIAAAPGHVLSDGDRVELYRPLAADPKTARRSRARASRPR